MVGRTETLSEFLSFELRRAYVGSSTLFSAMAAKGSLKPGQYSLLQTVACNPNEPLRMVAARLMIEPANLVPLVDDLEKKGYVERVANKSDKRARALRLTAQGRKVQKDCERVIMAHEHILTQGMSRADKRRLISNLVRIRLNCVEARPGPL